MATTWKEELERINRRLRGEETITKTPSGEIVSVPTSSQTSSQYSWTPQSAGKKTTTTTPTTVKPMGEASVEDTASGETKIRISRQPPSPSSPYIWGQRVYREGDQYYYEETWEPKSTQPIIREVKGAGQPYLAEAAPGFRLLEIPAKERVEVRDEAGEIVDVFFRPTKTTIVEPAFLSREEYESLGMSVLDPMLERAAVAKDVNPMVTYVRQHIATGIAGALQPFETVLKPAFWKGVASDPHLPETVGAGITFAGTETIKQIREEPIGFGIEMATGAAIFYGIGRGLSRPATWLKQKATGIKPTYQYEAMKIDVVEDTLGKSPLVRSSGIAVTKKGDVLGIHESFATLGKETRGYTLSTTEKGITSMPTIATPVTIGKGEGSTLFKFSGKDIYFKKGTGSLFKAEPEIVQPATTDHFGVAKGPGRIYMARQTQPSAKTFLGETPETWSLMVSKPLEKAPFERVGKITFFGKAREPAYLGVALAKERGLFPREMITISKGIMKEGKGSEMFASVSGGRKLGFGMGMGPGISPGIGDLQIKIPPSPFGDLSKFYTKQKLALREGMQFMATPETVSRQRSTVAQLQKRTSLQAQTLLQGSASLQRQMSMQQQMQMSGQLQNQISLQRQTRMQMQLQMQLQLQQQLQKQVIIQKTMTMQMPRMGPPKFAQFRFDTGPGKEKAIKIINIPAKRRYRYVPDITSMMLGIRENIPKGILSGKKMISGLEMRPMPSRSFRKRTRRGKRRK